MKRLIRRFQKDFQLPLIKLEAMSVAPKPLRTAETGRRITQEALDYVYEQSRWQPWIVNSLFIRATQQILDEESVETVDLLAFEKMITEAKPNGKS